MQMLYQGYPGTTATDLVTQNALVKQIILTNVSKNNATITLGTPLSANSLTNDVLLLSAYELQPNETIDLDVMLPLIDASDAQRALKALQSVADSIVVTVFGEVGLELDWIPKIIYQGQPGTSLGQIYQVPTGKTVIVKQLFLTNTNSVTKKVTIDEIPIPNMSIDKLELLDLTQILESEDIVQANQEISGSITITMTGVIK